MVSCITQRSLGFLQAALGSAKGGSPRDTESGQLLLDLGKHLVSFESGEAVFNLERRKPAGTLLFASETQLYTILAWHGEED